eukprot:SAG11_NODE_1835_length_4188_cov_2.482514_4_plen_204_part_00
MQPSCPLCRAPIEAHFLSDFTSRHEVGFGDEAAGAAEAADGAGRGAAPARADAAQLLAAEGANQRVEVLEGHMRCQACGFLPCECQSFLWQENVYSHSQQRYWTSVAGDPPGFVGRLSLTRPNGPILAPPAAIPSVVVEDTTTMRDHRKHPNLVRCVAVRHAAPSCPTVPSLRSFECDAIVIVKLTIAQSLSLSFWFWLHRAC